MTVIMPQLRIKSSQMVVAHTFNPSTHKAEAGETLMVPGNSSLQELISGQARKLQRNPVSKQKIASTQTIQRISSRVEGF